MKIDFSQAEWLHKPNEYLIDKDLVSIVTEPNTDFWQRTYYGFRNNNAPALIFSDETNFTFTTKVKFDYQVRFDQCGLLIYLDAENWFKVSVEFENAQYSRLGSVVTNNGHSDWATIDIPTRKSIWYRLSRRGPDFLAEFSFDGLNFSQMRIFHLAQLGETLSAMGNDDFSAGLSPIKLGVYACSPQESSFEAIFKEMKFEPCLWEKHSA